MGLLPPARGPSGQAHSQPSPSEGGPEGTPAKHRETGTSCTYVHTHARAHTHAGRYTCSHRYAQYSTYIHARARTLTQPIAPQDQPPLWKVKHRDPHSLHRANVPGTIWEWLRTTPAHPSCFPCLLPRLNIDCRGISGPVHIPQPLKNRHSFWAPSVAIMGGPAVVGPQHVLGPMDM